MAANRLRRQFDPERVDITVIDKDNDHVYQPGLLFVPFGLATADEIVRPRDAQLHDDIQFIKGIIAQVDLENDDVILKDQTRLHYDLLLVASGAELLLDETPGLTGSLWNKDVFSFYDLAGATALAERLESFVAGELIVNIVDMPIKCPVAPLEFAFLADWYFTEKGVRDAIGITYVTPLDGAFTKPVAAKALRSLLAEKNIKLVAEFNTGEVDNERGMLVGYDGTEIPFDLAVVIPLHGGASFIEDSDGLGDELGFVLSDPETMQSLAKPNIFVLGDAADIPTSKAGSVAHFAGEVVVDNVAAFLEGQELPARFDGHANCFIETGFSKALLIDFNYETEPLPGHYPGPLGLPLLKESRVNHLGKLMFQWFYWHGLLPGRDVPGVGHDMPNRGKDRETASAS